MEENENNQSKINDTIDSVTNLVNAIPIYQDAVQPVAKEIGKSLQVVGKTVNLALEPLRGLIWGYDQIKNFVEITVTERLQNTSLEKIITPDPRVVVPAIEALKLTGREDELKNMFSELIANSINSDTKELSHPSFVEIIKQLSSDEAKILFYISELPFYPMIAYIRVESNASWGQMIFDEVSKQFPTICKEAKIKHIDLSQNYLDNLRRLQLVEFTQEIEGRRLEKRQEKLEIETDRQEFLQVTKFGQQFIKICIGKD